MIRAGEAVKGDPRLQFDCLLIFHLITGFRPIEISLGEARIHHIGGLQRI